MGGRARRGVRFFFGVIFIGLEIFSVRFSFSFDFLFFREFRFGRYFGSLVLFCFLVSVVSVGRVGYSFGLEGFCGLFRFFFSGEMS